MAGGEFPGSGSVGLEDTDVLGYLLAAEVGVELEVQAPAWMVDVVLTNRDLDR